MRKFLIVAATVATLAVPAVASADTPDGSFAFKANETLNDTSHASKVGELSSQIKQNGQHVSGNGLSAYDQTTTAGSRADAVQDLLGH